MKLSFPLFLLFAATVDVSAEMNAPHERGLKKAKNKDKKKCKTHTYLVPQINDALTFIPASLAFSLADGTDCVTGESLVELAGNDEVGAEFITFSAILVAIAATKAVAAAGVGVASGVGYALGYVAVTKVAGGRERNLDEDKNVGQICAGDRFVASPKRIFKNNSPAGFLTFTNTFVSAEEVLSTGVFFFEDGSDITYTGFSGSAMGIGPKFALTGGTGKYDGVHGTATFDLSNGVDVSVEIKSCF